MLDCKRDINGEALLDFTRRIIRIPSISLEEKAVSEVIAAEMTRLGFDAVETDAMHNVVGRLRGTGDGPSLLLNGHMDHAAEGDMVAPHDATIIDGHPYGHDGPVVHGRGACDNKGGVASMIYAASAVRASGTPLRGDCIVSVSAREEMAKGEGIQFMLQNGLTADCAISVEATNLGVYVGHRGKAEFAIETKGRTSHAGLPQAGVNAILHMNKVLNALVSAYEMPTHPILGRASWTVIDIAAWPGRLTPIVPDRCEIVLDRRFFPEETTEDLAAGIKAVLDRVANDTSDFQPGITPLKRFPAHLTDPGGPVVMALRQARERELGPVGALGTWYFGGEGAFLERAGIPCVGFGPGDEHLAHTPNDVVPVSHLTDAAKVLARTIVDICG
ncbi:MAG: M20 family metallopeptidase [Solidesulfovibrio sp.]